MEDLELFEYQIKVEMLWKRIDAYLTELQYKGQKPRVDKQVVANSLLNASGELRYTLSYLEKVILPS